MELFGELTLIFSITALVAFVLALIKQPLVVAYIIAGIIVGPSFLGILHSAEELEIFSHAGIVFLLFIVGIHLNPKVIREVGGISLITGVGQIIFTSFFGYLLASLLGFTHVHALYIAIALTFSSTIIILKLITDRRDLEKLYAKIAIGFLLVQDLVATAILIGVSIAAQPHADGLGATLLNIGSAGVLLVLGLVIGARFVLPKVLGLAARSTELLFVISIAWGIGVATLFEVAGFSVEVGALAAGIALSTSRYAEEIASRFKPLRDFFIIIFFLLLGSSMGLGDLSAVALPAVLLSIFVLVGNPIIVYILMNLMGYGRRTGFMAGLTVAQISEFSLILAALALQVGHITPEVVSLITFVGLITIAISTYMVLYSDALFIRVLPLLKLLEFKKQQKREPQNTTAACDALLFGYDRVGHAFLEAFCKLEKPVGIVDYNPDNIQRVSELEQHNDTVISWYGDAGDVDFLEELPIHTARILVSTIPNQEVNVLLTKFSKHNNPGGVVVVLAHTTHQAHELYAAGATYVLMPHHLGAQHAARLITRYDLETDAFEKLRIRHIEWLKRWQKKASLV